VLMSIIDFIAPLGFLKESGDQSVAGVRPFP
jgi:hypothetical protein